MENVTATCARCHTSFYIIKKEQEFLSHKGLPHPTMCPACRQLRRLSLRGARRELYKATCQKCGTQIVVTYDPSTVSNMILCRQDYDQYMVDHDPIITDPLPET